MPAPLIVRYCATGAAKSRNMATTSPEIDVQFARVMCRLACTALAALPEPLMTGASNDAHSPLSVPLRIGEPAGPAIVPFRVPLSLECTFTAPGSPTCEVPEPANDIVPVTELPFDVMLIFPWSGSVPPPAFGICGPPGMSMCIEVMIVAPIVVV